MRNPIASFFRIEPVDAPGAAAAAYVPWVMVSRGLAFVRTLLVARILGEAGKEAFGLYQPALELVNPLVALVLFGAADVAERYVSQVERQQGGAGLRQWIVRRWRRLLIIGGIIGVVMILAGDWISRVVWGSQQGELLAASVAAVLCLALYQHLAATLRGLRAYGAAAGMELLNAILLLALSIAAATTQSSGRLMEAYLISVLVPLVLYAGLFLRHARQIEIAATENAPPKFSSGDLLAYAAAPDDPKLGRFAAWALVRLLLVMLFGFLSIWGISVLAERISRSDLLMWGPIAVAHYSVPYRIAQLLGFVAVTLWASSYAISARLWSHGRVKRAKVQLLRTGRIGMAVMLLLTVALLFGRGALLALLPDYGEAIQDLLPRMLALFLGYGFMMLLSSYADLRESPQEGAAMWGIATLAQCVGIIAASLLRPAWDPMDYMLAITCAGLAAGILIVGPLILRPLRFTATSVPLALMIAAAGSLFAPAWVVNWVAGPVLLGVVAFLWSTGLLIRPADRRVLRRWKKRRGGVHVAARATSEPL